MQPFEKENNNAQNYHASGTLGDKHIMKKTILLILLMVFLFPFLENSLSQIKQLQEPIDSLAIDTIKPTISVDTLHIAYATITCYQPIASQCYGNPLITADGSKIDLDKLKQGEIKWVAVSHDLYSKYFKKDKSNLLYIEGYGVFEVHDTTSKRFRNRVDILISPSEKATIFEKNVKIAVIKSTTIDI